MHALDRSDDRHLLAIKQILDRLELRIIVVATRVIVEHVTQSLHAQLAERLGMARTDALQHSQICIEGSRRGRGLRTCYGLRTRRRRGTLMTLRLLRFRERSFAWRRDR